MCGAKRRGKKLLFVHVIIWMGLYAWSIHSNWLGQGFNPNSVLHSGVSLFDAPEVLQATTLTNRPPCFIVQY